MEQNKIYNEDCAATISRLEDASVSLIVTSPPYEAMKSYGKSIENKVEQEWVDWLVSIFQPLHSKLKDDGSIIINVNASVKNKCRSLAPQRLQVALSDVFCHYDAYIWTKKQGIPAASRKRLDNKHEYIFHFTKTNTPKMDTSQVMVKKSPGAMLRQKYLIRADISKKVTDSGLVIGDYTKKFVMDTDTKIPYSYLDFKLACALRGKPQNKHPAPFHPSLPEFFIKLLTNEGDLVYDPFSGSGTTLGAAKKLGRNYIGSEMNAAYIPLIEETLQGATDGAN